MKDKITIQLPPPPPIELTYEDLNPPLRRIADAIGLEGTVTLSMVYGGSYITIPSHQHLAAQETHPLIHHLGREDAIRFAAAFGPLWRYWVPSIMPAVRSAQKRHLKELLKHTPPRRLVRQTPYSYRVSEVTILQLKKQTKHKET